MTETRSSRPINLLSIDVESEIARLADGALDGLWQLPVELVRRAESARARAIAVRLDRREMVIEDDGRALSRAALEHLACVADGHAPSDLRHTALMRLEATEPTLVLLASTSIAVLVLESGGHRLTCRRGRRPSVTERDDLRGIATRLRVKAHLERRRAADALRGACRFARARITLDGQALPRGFTGALVEAPLRAPLNGRLAIRASGEGSHVWVLADGVVAAHATLAADPPFDAAIALDGESPAAAPLRSRLQPLVPDLVRQAFDLACHAARGHEHTRPMEQQEQLTRGLLAAARRLRRLGAIMPLPLIPAVVGGEPARLSLQTLAGRVDRWPAILPHEDPAQLLPSRHPVLVLGAELRAALAGLIGLRFVSPPRRPPARRTPRALWTSTRDAARGLWTRLTGRAGARIPDDRLEPAEAALRRALGTALGAGGIEDVIVRAGRAAPCVAAGRLYLAREHPDVVAAAKCVARDASWVYPALLRLAPEHRTALARARHAWLTAGDPEAIVIPRR